jgi:hypothetical protein
MKLVHSREDSDTSSPSRIVTARTHHPKDGGADAVGVGRVEAEKAENDGSEVRMGVLEMAVAS